MMKHTIDRFGSNPIMGTFGQWKTLLEGAWVTQGYTVERPWIVNELFPAGVPFESCIPAGTYELVPFQSERWGKTWAFVNPELGVIARQADKAEDWFRYACLVHPANWMLDVEGCVGVGDGLSAGMRKSSQDIDWMVTNSGDTVKAIQSHLSKHERHTVTIRDVGATHTFRS